MKTEMPCASSNMNGITSTILPPDEFTQEMAVDCPIAYTMSDKTLMTRHPSPYPPEDDPPPTPLDGSVVNAQLRKSARNIASVAEAAANLPQPPMNFTRIHNLRESIRRQEELKAQNQKLKEGMNKEESFLRLERVKNNKYKDNKQRNLQGVENVGYVDEDNQNAVQESIEDMMTLLNTVSQNITDESLIDDLVFVKSLVQQGSFHEALSLHHVLVSSTTSQTSDSLPICPETLSLKPLSDEVGKELQFCHLDEANELSNILKSSTLQSMMGTHDTVAQNTVSASKSLDCLLETPPPKIPKSPQEDEIVLKYSEISDKPVRVVTINKTNEALGATVKCEEDRVMIGRVVSGGALQRSGLIREGDEILEVNGRQVKGLDVNQVGDMIAALNGDLVFVLASPSQPELQTTVPQHSNNEVINVVKHVRALFDYDAFDDAYLPCRELGLSFQKGEVLRIMSTDDEDWWQAHHDADDDTHLTLAGLIPSHRFQMRREEARLAMMRDTQVDEVVVKSSLFCRHKKKKTSKVSTPIIEDEIATYEDMALYHQPEDKKRPIVLIGPANVGRAELRQRLVDNDSERFVRPVPHTSRAKKSNENNGDQYHFVTRDTFMQMNSDGQFLEQATYQKEFYGTSIPCIQNLILGGKICILNLHAESLPLLSNTSLMPYIIFISPPPLEKLRLNTARERKQVKEDELREIIDAAREMEMKFAQYFDETIRNVDLDRSYAELLRLINKLDTEPQWVPVRWLD